METSKTGAAQTLCRETDGARAARATIDLAAVVANWMAFQRLAGGGECAAVVKADAYGLGGAHVARALAMAGARTFFTATVAEALGIRRALGAEPDVIALNGAAEHEIAQAREAGVRLTLNSLPQARAFRQTGGGIAPVVHVDTGMNRLGLSAHDSEGVRALLGDIRPWLVMSHLACASSRGHPMNLRQRDDFIAAAAAFPGVRRSLAASAGAQLGQDFAFDMIRPGIGLYGWSGMDEGGLGLACTATVSAPVLQTRVIPAGATVGYGASFTASKDTPTATIACGYADGFLRAGCGRAAVGFAGQVLAVLGRVSMDLIVADATDAPDLAAGDQVELLGPTIRAEQAAAAAGTLPYEVFTTFVGRAARSYTGGR